VHASMPTSLFYRSLARNKDEPVKESIINGLSSNVAASSTVPAVAIYIQTLKTT